MTNDLDIAKQEFNLPTKITTPMPGVFTISEQNAQTQK